jgi:hypothetical protein
LLGGLKTKDSTIKHGIVYVLVISLFFSLAHMFVSDVGIKSLVFYFPMLGALSGFLYWSVESIIPAVTVHMV